MICRLPTASLFAMWIAFVCFGASGCCGIPNGPAISQAQHWVDQGMPAGTNSAAASSFLESKGFTVHLYDSEKPRQLIATKHIGKCRLNMTYDDLYVISALDDSDRVKTTTVSNGVSPGI